VKEHLELFAAIKDVPKEETEAAIDEMIAQVGLTEKVNDKSAALSGGMKRKLSVGIALLGDSKIVFLSVFFQIAHARLRIRGRCNRRGGKRGCFLIPFCPFPFCVCACHHL
jgi:ABC-type taurine transport system ATPase subunit